MKKLHMGTMTQRMKSFINCLSCLDFHSESGFHLLQVYFLSTLYMQGVTGKSPWNKLSDCSTSILTLAISLIPPPFIINTFPSTEKWADEMIAIAVGP